VHPWASVEVFTGGKRRNFAYPFQINGQNNMSGEKTTKLDTLAKLFQAMTSETVCWQDLLNKLSWWITQNSPQQI